MALRVTPGMMHGNMMRNINNNLTRLEHQQNMLSSGRKLSKPSDDPVGITYSLRYRSELGMNEQYDKNISSALSQLQHMDDVLGQLNDMAIRLQELTTQAMNDTNPQSALDAISVEVQQIYEQLVNAGNDTFNGKYIFNGQKTDKQPYDAVNAPNQNTDIEKTYIRLSAGVSVSVNVNGEEVFGAAGAADNLFKVIKDIEASLAAPSNKTALAVASGNLKTRFDKILNIRSEVGARTNRIELIDERLKDLTLNLNELQGKTEDADMAETIMKFNMQQNVYQASLSIGAKIIQPTLVDYLR